MSIRINDEERRQWIMNDEGLYCWYRSSCQTLRAFIKANRKGIDACITMARGQRISWD